MKLNGPVLIGIVIIIIAIVLGLALFLLWIRRRKMKKIQEIQQQNPITDRGNPSRPIVIYP